MANDLLRRRAYLLRGLSDARKGRGLSEHTIYAVALAREKNAVCLFHGVHVLYQNELNHIVLYAAALCRWSRWFERAYCMQTINIVGGQIAC
jgi:hypothetical protein